MAVGRPLRIAHATVMLCCQLPRGATGCRNYPEMRVFSNAVDGCDLAPSGGVSDRLSIRRPDRIVFTAARLRNLSCLSAEIDGEDIGVVVCVRVRFVVGKEDDLVAARAEVDGVVVEQARGELLWRGSFDVDDPNVCASIIRKRCA